jgi:hypothetical protein
VAPIIISSLVTADRTRRRASMRKGLAIAVAAMAFSAVVAGAAQQGTAAKKLLVKNTATRKLVYKAKNNTGTVTDPTVSGATFNLQLTTGGTGGGTQCFPLPAAGWTAISTLGFKYKDRTLANGPVKVALIKRAPSGVFGIKIIAKGTGITVTPGDPSTTGYATNFSVSGGDEYCGSTGSVVPNPNNATTFNVVNDDGTTCSLGPC